MKVLFQNNKNWASYMCLVRKVKICVYHKTFVKFGLSNSRNGTSCAAMYRQVGVTLNSEVTLNSHVFSMETYWLVSITAMSQGVRVLDQSLKVSTPHSPNFLNVPITFDLLFCLNNEKIWCFETKLWLRQSID